MNSEEVWMTIHDYPFEFKLGYEEGLESMGVTYDDDPGSPRSVAYDLGRSLRQGMEVSL